jgi:hypothetical protein
LVPPRGVDNVSLGIVFKGPEGMVLAADSRVTLTFKPPVPAAPAGMSPVPILVVPAFYDNATKLLRCAGQDYVAAVTYGLGALGQTEPRTAHSYIPELETELAGEARLGVKDFATRLGQFFLGRFQASGTPIAPENQMHFLIGGYNEGEAYGRIYEVIVPTRIAPVEQNANVFGVSWGGQTQIVNRLMNGLDQFSTDYIKQKLKIADQDMAEATREATQLHALKIPYQFLPLQDCVDLSILLVKTTSQLMLYTTDIRGVGGAVDVATITRTEGYKNVQSKQIRGERTIQ